MSDELAPNEAQALADAETTIEQGYAGFLKVGLALANIRDQKLYRATHTTFADYCDQRWHLGKTHAYRLIEAGEVAALLSPMGDIPTTERQARALKTIIDEHGPDVAAKVLDETKSTGTVTATSITEKATELGYGQPATVTTRRSESTTITVDTDTGEIVDAPTESVEAQFTSDERELLERLKDGRTVVLNMRADSHARLWAWADAHDLAVRIDRKSDWGNPFVLDEDGDREQVIGKYAAFYLPHKPQLIANAGQLKGKALGCWCAPERCHGDVLAAAAS